MIKVSQRIGDEHRVRTLKEFINESVCISREDKDGNISAELACGELHSVTKGGIGIWHMGEERFLEWDEFNIVELFPHV